MKVENSIMHAILEEIERDKKANPNYPAHACGQVATIAVEIGNMHAAAVNLKYRKGKVDEQKERLRQHAIKAAAITIRFLENL